jgi:transcriptional regulator of arginine metabolism
MSDKATRQDLIRDLVRTRPIASQEELRQLLAVRGWQVTQSTLSRDMKELGLARVQTAQGPRYTVPEHAAGEADRATLESLVPRLCQKIDGVGEMVVIKTIAAGAQPVAEALDLESSPDVLGTLAGDNVVLVICRSEQARDRLTRRLTSIVRRG